MINNRESLKSNIEFYSSITEKQILKFINSLKNSPSILLDSMKYSVLGAGKKLRPSLLLGTYEIFEKKNIEQAVSFAASIEMIHTYSLIHDDLPVMDNDDLRRGKPSNHKVYGDAGAILAGDALLNSAFENIMNLLVNTSNKNVFIAAKILFEASGANGMIGGQILDMGLQKNSNDMKKMHSMKTGALIKASVLIGAYLASCSEKNIKLLEKYAISLGIAFQIKDDILDVESSDKELGKPVGSDKKNNKITYVTEYGLDKAKELLDNHIEKSIDFISDIDRDTSFLKDIALYVKNRRD